MRRPGFGCALLVMLLLLVPATATSLESASVAGDNSLTHYVGTKGVDDLTVGVEAPKWVFKRNDATQEAPIAAGEHCADTSGGEQKTVACDLTEFTEIDLGDGADRLIGGAAANELVVHAGPGQDLLTISSDDSNVIDGEDDDDTFELGGGSGQDTVSGSAGNDLFREPVGADTISGGPGSDTVAYQFSPAESLTVTLDDQPNDGPGGDQNVHSDVENLTGGQENDRFVGSATANVLRGGQGDDEIDGGPGRDTLEGGEDEDKIYALDGEPDTIDCGFGEDSATVDTIDTVVKCEQVKYPDAAIAAVVPAPAALVPGLVPTGSLAKGRLVLIRGGSGSASFRCRAPAGDSCTVKGKVALKAKGKKVGTVSGTVGGGRTGPLTIRLNGTGTDLLADGGALSAKITATITDEAGATSPFNPMIRLKPAPKPRRG